MSDLAWSLLPTCSRTWAQAALYLCSGANRGEIEFFSRDDVPRMLILIKMMEGTVVIPALKDVTCNAVPVCYNHMYVLLQILRSCLPTNHRLTAPLGQRIQQVIEASWMGHLIGLIRVLEAT